MTPTLPGRGLIEWLAFFGAMAGGACLLAMALLTSASVLSRYFFARPFLGTFEIVELLTGVAVLAFFPYTHLRRHNVVADFFTRSASLRVRNLMDAIADIVFLLMAAFLAWRVSVGFLESLHSPSRSFVLGMPEWVFYAPAACWMIVWAIVSLFVSIESLARARG